MIFYLPLGIVLNDSVEILLSWITKLMTWREKLVFAP